VILTFAALFVAQNTAMFFGGGMGGFPEGFGGHPGMGGMGGMRGRREEVDTEALYTVSPVSCT
jgi:hypothetical protein